MQNTKYVWYKKTYYVYITCTSAYVENEVGGVVGVSADLLEVVDGAVHEELERAHLLAEVDRRDVVLQRACAQHALPNL